MKFSSVLFILLIFSVATASENCPVTEEQIHELQKVADCGASDDSFACMDMMGISLTKENKLPGAIGSAFGADASLQAMDEIRLAENAQKKEKKKTGFFQWLSELIESVAWAGYYDNNIARGDIMNYAEEAEKAIDAKKAALAEDIKKVHEGVYDLRVGELQAKQLELERQRIAEVKKFVAQRKLEKPEVFTRYTDETLAEIEKLTGLEKGKRDDLWRKVTAELRAGIDLNFEDKPIAKVLRTSAITDLPKPDALSDMEYAKNRITQLDAELKELESKSQRRLISGDQYAKAKAALEGQRSSFSALNTIKEASEQHGGFLDEVKRYNRDFRVGSIDPSDSKKMLSYFAETDGLVKDEMALFKRDMFIKNRFPQKGNLPDRIHSQSKVLEGRSHMAMKEAESRAAKEFDKKMLAQQVGKGVLKGVSQRVAAYFLSGPGGIALAADDAVELMTGNLNPGCQDPQIDKYISHQECVPVSDILSPQMMMFLNLGNYQFQMTHLNRNKVLCEKVKKAVDDFLPTRWHLQCNEKRNGFKARLPETGVEQEIFFNSQNQIQKILLTQEKTLGQKTAAVFGVGENYIEGGRTSIPMDNGKPQFLCVREDTYLNSAVRSVATLAEGKDPGTVGCNPSYNKVVEMKDVSSTASYYPPGKVKTGQMSLNFYRANMFAMMEMAQCCSPNSESSNADRCLEYEKPKTEQKKIPKRDPAALKKGQ